ncbi:MAG: type II CAAX endopeptidase family protein [Tissierellia bacterium]|nr:type II CAAX endopeptidase family protein [Tissierellia bacterium]
MDNKKIYSYPLIYFLLSVIGFSILNYFGIQYDDPRIHFYGIPMMLVIAGFVIYANGKNRLIKKEDFKRKSSFALLNWIPILTILMIITVFGEMFMRNGEVTKVLWAMILTFLIGFSEEGMFRHFIIQQGETIFSSMALLIYSTVSFGLLHMANMASGLDFIGAFTQSIYTLPFGLLAAFLYMETKNITALIFWHMSVDFSLFLLELGEFKSATYCGKAIDIIMILATLILLYRKGKSRLDCRKEKN